ncbi:YtxH domain-containing protein [Tuberibacillus sp. Marseille-P3662]|uniref:YtxH domain-containing protein n=1 Tax=Tuberibacillus sp. Marseille-P3662 TaxID=1965358 RepID=UPI000A1CA23A|nr:YtxH domain-containing protein [Tuberibacillus sp. Marseille-P3662]
MSNGNGKNFVKGAVVGSLVGAVTALLMAPKSGQDLRDDLRSAKDQDGDWTTYAKHKSQDLTRVIADQSNQLLGKVKEWQSIRATNLNNVTSMQNDTTNTYEPGGIEIPKND